METDIRSASRSVEMTIHRGRRALTSVQVRASLDSSQLTESASRAMRTSGGTEGRRNVEQRVPTTITVS